MIEYMYIHIQNGEVAKTTRQFTWYDYVASAFFTAKNVEFPGLYPIRKTLDVAIK